MPPASDPEVSAGARTAGMSILLLVVIGLFAAFAINASSLRTESSAIKAAVAAAEQKDWTEAETLYTRAIDEARPGFLRRVPAETFAGRGLARFHLGRYEGALADFDRSEGAGGDPATVLPYRALILFREDDPDSGFALLEEVDLLSLDLALFLKIELAAHMATGHFKRGQVEEALALAAFARRHRFLLDSGLSAALDTAAVEAFVDAGKWEEAAAAAERILDTGEPGAREFAVLAYRAYLKSDGETADRLANAALALAPDYGLARLVRGSRAIWEFRLSDAAADLEAARAAMPDSAHAHAMAAYLAVLQEDLQRARRAAGQAAAAEPGSPFALWAEALTASAEYDEARARDLMDQAISLDGSRPEFYVTRFETYRLFHDRIERGSADLGAALELAPEYGFAKAALARLEAERYRFELLESTGSSLVRHWPESSEGYALLSSFHTARAEFDAALALAERAVEAEPWSARALLDRARANLNLERYEFARRDLEEAQLRYPDRVETHLIWSEWYLARAEYESALERIETAAQLDPSDPLPMLARARFYLWIGDLASTQDALRAALRMDPHWPELLFIQAQLHLEYGETAMAETLLDQVGAAYPNKPGVFTLRAEIAYLDGNLFLAGQQARQAVELNPAETGAHRILAQIDLAGGDVPGAIARLEQALAFRTDDAALHALLGRALYRAAREAEAVESFTRAIDLHAMEWSYHFERSLARMYAGDPLGAVADAERALSLADEAQAIDAISVHLAALHTIPPALNGFRNLAGEVGDLAYELRVPERWAVIPTESQSGSGLNLYFNDGGGAVWVEFSIGADLFVTELEDVVNAIAGSLTTSEGIWLLDQPALIRIDGLDGLTRTYSVLYPGADNGFRRAGRHFYFYENGTVIHVDLWSVRGSIESFTPEVQAMIAGLRIIR